MYVFFVGVFFLHTVQLEAVMVKLTFDLSNQAALLVIDKISFTAFYLFG